MSIAVRQLIHLIAWPIQEHHLYTKHVAIADTRLQVTHIRRKLLHLCAELVLVVIMTLHTTCLIPRHQQLVKHVVIVDIKLQAIHQQTVEHLLFIRNVVSVGTP